MAMEPGSYDIEVEMVVVGHGQRRAVVTLIVAPGSNRSESELRSMAEAEAVRSGDRLDQARGLYAIGSRIR